MYEYRFAAVVADQLSGRERCLDSGVDKENIDSGVNQENIHYGVNLLMTSEGVRRTYTLESIS